ncbi:conserved hypothetical protein, partial [Ixodes scapularis]
GASQPRDVPPRPPPRRQSREQTERPRMQITGAACHAPRMPSGRRPPRAESVAGRANGRPPLRERVSASLQTSPDLGIQTDPPGSVGEECGLPIPRPANKSRPHHCPFEPT